MNEQKPDVSDDVRTAVVELLRSRPKKACFITEVRASLERPNVDAQKVERALTELEADGALIIRDHYCADPHLEGVDLRIVALVENGEGPDAQMSAIHKIDSAWDKWLADYLANHRCG